MLPTIVVLAAGGSSRFGRPKPLEPIGPDGATLLHFLLYDAIRCGFGSAVIVTSSDTEDQLLESVTARFPRFEVHSVQQPAPGASGAPPGRTKPLGTGHAVLAASGAVDGPFAVANADDFYGLAALGDLADHLTTGPVDEHALVGYRLDRTLSPHGGVSRAVCVSGPAGHLADLVEVLDVSAVETGASGRGTDRRVVQLRGDDRVSMNLWGFRPSVASVLGGAFTAFLSTLDPERPEHGEFLLSEAVGSAIRSNQIAVRLIPTESRWFGITFDRDTDDARIAAAERIEAGDYPREIRCG